MQTQTYPPAPRQSKRIILTHEDGVGGSYRYETEDIYYNEETKSLNQNNHDLMNNDLEDFKNKVTTLNHSHKLLIKLIEKLSE